MDEQNINTESENVQTEEKKEHKPSNHLNVILQ